MRESQRERADMFIRGERERFSHQTVAHVNILMHVNVGLVSIQSKCSGELSEEWKWLVYVTNISRNWGDNVS